ncbi:4-hydroxythreonine-4-phosphate dehydrogenase PdxA [Qipengyuania vesicularis]|uniref:4-hydroxythreonine-4-phosphate dehydrogenase PdxA n=1 Tax=Qipengyuania vesicularis TaxID=2867232 RepID=UPI001C86F879|nr:4-hydroxythreonine-4-phosphate dehydrogenase PdxA [Qipengyuania vesicularis]MBX7527339.1 4-hydroxythreonine-4-phosphate dehydrogenase PdxA [Qipengyuania vesicularis]
MTSLQLPLAVSLGDPAGIGPEIIAEAWARRDADGIPPFFVVGGAGVLHEAAGSRGLDITIERIEAPAQAIEVWTRALPVLGADDAPYTPGAPEESGARLALFSLVEATSRAALGEASGIVTAPISKAELAQVGFTQPGQTEFLADAFGKAREDAVMMLAGPSLRAVPLTVHCSLAEVPDLLSKELIVHRARIVHRALQRDFGIVKPRLAVSGLNPHAGENGKFGDEEQFVIGPAVSQLESEGLDITGPHPGDAIFTPRARKSYDAALAMYHDQALIPLKALDFDEGVNVTLGLPVVRTSPDHGTAFDIAGKGKADPGAMIAALRMAGDMAARRATDG